MALVLASSHLSRGKAVEVRTTAGMMEPAMDCASQRDSLEMP